MDAAIKNYTELKLLPELLLPWFQAAQRKLPWREDREPYHVWVSEIMLQQTRVEAVKSYYTRFISQIPDVMTLAEIEDDALMKLWEGLGYYSRARNLKKAAITIKSEYGGSFPTDYENIRKLSGIGDYTAGAIASICFDQPTPAVDGNVLRVITRYTGDYASIDDLKTKKKVAAALAEIYPRKAGDFTQALMELGALICVPNGEPKCAVCPLQKHCIAKQKLLIDELPVRSEKKRRRKDEMTLFLLRCDNQYAIRKRPENGLLSGLYEFPNVSGVLSAEDAITQASDWKTAPYEIHRTVTKKHIFTHVEWDMHAIRLDCRKRSSAFLWVSSDELASSYALPTAFRQFIPELD